MATATTINFYSRYATEHLVIDEDEKGLFCQVCSEPVKIAGFRPPQQQDGRACVG